VSGEQLVCNNEDAEDRMMEILDQAQTSTIWKMNVWNNRKKGTFGWCRDYTEDQSGIIWALREMDRILPADMRPYKNPDEV
jgi:predicted 3-demethylubiquinone-9 3-methyltransferase (glyoxalase superfamily)